jgi:DNA-binding GntR family transcriptional regulator
MSESTDSTSNGGRIALFRPHDVRTIRDEVYDQLRNAIIAGDLAPGERIKERDVATGMKISTTPVKEALRKLEQDGLVSGEPRRGAIVSSVALTAVEEIIEIRAALDSLGARLAASKLSREDAESLRNQLARMARSLEQHDAAALDAANSELHTMIRAASRNYFIARFVESLSPFATSVSSDALNDRREARRGYTEHVAIVEALVRQDADEAEKLMRAHLIRVDRFAVARSRKTKGESRNNRRQA